MKLGYKTGYKVPRCPSCLKYMHNPIESRSDTEWTFPHCGHYWIVEYQNNCHDINRIYDSVTGQNCYRCKGIGFIGFRDINGEYEVMRCLIKLPAYEGHTGYRANTKPEGVS